MVAYVALLRKDKNSDYGVDFPDFPGCVTAAPTMEEAVKAAKEALMLHLEGMQEDNDLIPEPSAMEQIMKEKFNKDAVAFLVEIAKVPERVKRINVTLPEDVLYAIDRITKNRSRFLAQAAREKLGN